MVFVVAVHVHSTSLLSAEEKWSAHYQIRITATKHVTVNKLQEKLDRLTRCQYEMGSLSVNSLAIMVSIGVEAELLP
jgi:hypothetical protein